MNKPKEIEVMLFNIYSGIGMDRPDNHDEILEFVVDDVNECADQENWHSGDVVIGFRRWIESNNNDDVGDNEPLVETVIEQTLYDLVNGNDKVIKALLKKLPWDVLKYSLPENKWSEFD